MSRSLESLLAGSEWRGSEQCGREREVFDVKVLCVGNGSCSIGRH